MKAGDFMEGWYIDYLDIHGQLKQLFMNDCFTDNDMSEFDNNIASARTILFLFEMSHKKDFHKFLSITRGVKNE